MCVCVCKYVRADELAMRISSGDAAVLQTLDLGLFWYDSCRYKV